MMKIVQLLPELNEGGVERGVVELNREFIGRGHESIVISRGGRLVEQIEQEGGEHFTFDVCSKNPLTVPARVLGLRRLLRELQPTIVHARSRVPAWLAYLANKKLRFPFITTVHGLNSISRYSQIMTKGDRVIVVGDPVGEHIRQAYPVNPDLIRVIHRGVDIRAFAPDKVDQNFINTFKQAHNLKGQFVVTSVGRITWLKDYETFIRAISLAQKEVPSIVGLIVGGAREDKQDYLQSLKNLARECNVEDRVLFVGSQKQMAEIYSLSDVLVNASLKMGNIARTIVEAFAMDTPVIATTYEGLTNLVEDGKNGYLIETRDPEGLADKLVKAHHASFSGIRANLNPDYTLDTMVSRTLETYRELL